MCSKFEIKVLY